MTRFLLSIAIIFVFGSAFCQSESEKIRKPIDLKKDQLTLDIESPLGVGFTAAWKINSFSSAGVGFQFGLGPRIILNNAKFLYCGSGCDEGDCCSFQLGRLAGDPLLELAQVQAFWRYYITPRTYFNAGIYASYDKFIMFELSPGASIFGIKTGIYSGFKHLKFGLNLQGGKVFLSYSGDLKTSFFLGYFWPVIQVYF
jgi:hypothetical protein